MWNMFLGKLVIENSQRGFIEGKSCLTNLVACYGEMTSFVDDRAVCVIDLGFNRISIQSATVFSCPN